MPIDFTDDQLAALPEDPDQAFVALAKLAIADYERQARHMRDDAKRVVILKSQLIDVLMAAASHYKVAAGLPTGRPDPLTDGADAAYDQFLVRLDMFVLTTRLKAAEHSRRYSVELDQAAREKLTLLITKAREIVKDLKVSEAKKDKLFKLLNDLQTEVDHKRTRFEAYAALAIEVADATGEVAKRLDPLAELLRKVGGIFGGAKNESGQKKLERPVEQKRLEPPQKRLEPPKDKGEETQDNELSETSP